VFCSSIFNDKHIYLCISFDFIEKTQVGEMTDQQQQPTSPRELTPAEKEEARLLKHVERKYQPKATTAPTKKGPAEWRKKQEEEAKRMLEEKKKAEEEKKKREEELRQRLEEERKQAEQQRQEQYLKDKASTEETPPPPRPAVAQGTVEETSIVADSGLAAKGEKAKKEAMRLAKMMGGQAVQEVKPLLSPARNYPVPDKPQYGTKFELDLWSEMNRVRSNPEEFVPILQVMAKRFDALIYDDVEQNVKRPTKEGAAAVEEAIKFLQSQKPMGMEGWLKMSDGLSRSCLDLVAKQGPNGDLGSTESKDEAAQRLSAYGEFSGKCTQSVAYTTLPPRDIVIQWIIDDGNKERTDRATLFDPSVKFVGIASGPHKVTKRMVAAAFAEAYTSKEVLAERAREAKEAEANETVTRTASFQIGELTETPDGKAYKTEVDKIEGTADTLKLMLIERNTMLHLQQVIKTGNKTNEWNQKFGLPFPFAASDISAEYSHSQGKLTIYLKKPGAEIDDTQEHTVTTFTVPADPHTEETKVTVKPEQRPDCILFKCVPSKFETEVKVVISGKRLAFHTTHSFDDKDESGEAVVRTIKSTQTFTLPWAVSLDLISFVPVQNEGQHVKVMKPLPLQVSETPVEIYIKPLP
jgi:chemotaxis protein histidine kinase CheA